jgi:hypothetical protein
MTPTILRTWILEARARWLLFQLKLHVARRRPDPARLRVLAARAHGIEAELLTLRQRR